MNIPNRDKTHCKRGHALPEERDARGKRRCKICDRVNKRGKRKRRTARVDAKVKLPTGDLVIINEEEAQGIPERASSRDRPRKRSCLMCGELFDSFGFGNRRCLPCETGRDDDDELHEIEAQSFHGLAFGCKRK